MKIDVNTSMGLQAPFMCLLNPCQFGKIGREGLTTVAETVWGMCCQGYDFQHFSIGSTPEMII